MKVVPLERVDNAELAVALRRTADEVESMTEPVDGWMLTIVTAHGNVASHYGAKDASGFVSLLGAIENSKQDVLSTIRE